MNKNELIGKIGSKLSKINFYMRKHSPGILITTGVIGTVLGAVMACKATTKIGGIIDQAKEDIDSIHNDDHVSSYTESDKTKDIFRVYAKTALRLGKLYALPVAIGGLSLAGVLASNNILRKRNVALAAAYIAVDSGFKKYRSNVVSRFGDEVDRELRYDIRPEEVEEITDKNGKKKTTKKTVNMAHSDTELEYARVFDSSNPYWDREPGYNLLFLKSRQDVCNQELRSKGYLFINDVYDELNIPRSKAGQVVGWRYDHPSTNGDNYIDFDIREVQRKTAYGYETVYMLDFNVDGNIWADM